MTFFVAILHKIIKANHIHKALNYLIALVWLVNGLFCKVLNLVPRHKQIVESISGSSHSGSLTIAIGIGEIIMAIWILCNYKSKLCALLQIVLIITMNVLEFTLTPDLLLWGRLNIIFALVFSFLIYYNVFIIKPKLANVISK